MSAQFNHYLLNRFKQDLFQEEMLWPKNNLTYGFGLNIFFTQGFLEKYIK